MTREDEARAVLNRIVVAHNRLHRSEITPAEFDHFAIGKLLDFAAGEANEVAGAFAAAIRALPATGEVGS